MVNGNSLLYPTEAPRFPEQVDELKTVLLELKNTIISMSRENKELADLVKYYGYTDWKSLTLLDRGEKARQMYEKVAGRRRA